MDSLAKVTLSLNSYEFKDNVTFANESIFTSIN